MAVTIAAAYLLGVAIGLIGYAWIATPERRRTIRQRDHYRDLYSRRTAEYVYLLRRFGGDTPLAVDAAAAVEARRVLSADERAWESELG